MPQGARIVGSFNEQFKAIEMEVSRVQGKLVKDIYDGLLQPGVSRIFSGYYKSNHRVMVGSNASAKLVPSTRPKTASQFQFLDNVAIARNEELGKIGAIKVGSKVTIGTAVPYALELEARDATYQKAAAIGLSMVTVGSPLNGG